MSHESCPSLRGRGWLQQPQRGRGYGDRQGVRGSLIHTYSSLDTRDPGHNIDSTVSLTPTLQDPCEGTFSERCSLSAR